MRTHDFYNPASTALDRHHLPVGDEDCDVCGFGCDGEVRRHHTEGTVTDAAAWVAERVPEKDEAGS